MGRQHLFNIGYSIALAPRQAYFLWMTVSLHSTLPSPAFSDTVLTFVSQSSLLTPPQWESAYLSCLSQQVSGEVSNSQQLLIVLSFWQIAFFLSLTPSLPAAFLPFPLPSFSFPFLLSFPPLPFSQVQLSVHGSRSLLVSSFHLSCCTFLLCIIPFFLLLFWWSSIHLSSTDHQHLFF